MSDKKKISYSAWGKYMTCPKMYDFHYNERLRPNGTSSALLFGVAVDEALNALLLKTGDPIEVFRKNFEYKDDVLWDDRDLDWDLFDDEQIKKLENEKFSYQAWASMRIKGRMLIEAYIENVLPEIEEVESVQQELEERPGVLDAVLRLRGHGRVLIDHKTSARPYRDDSVTGDTQLALYAKSIGIKKAGFIVLVKEIRKNAKKICNTCSFNGSFTRHKTCPQIINGSRCHGSWTRTVRPEAVTQIIIDEIPDINKGLITESISQTEKAINAGMYPRNLKACGKIYGKPCPYIDKCWKNSNNGLSIKETTNGKSKK